ncbi:hypothetical protein [Burkholderia vietnamiensis]|uniref:hypothetical protein n=1 Tax=Burkholderia cepacia complex TaxID=87882 RepID=UPI001D14BD5C|nr:hypothetical protein [Burkholderia vietnamiensis]UEC05593.1 hypothetical protein LK462_34720 [Burkholderia vietnamiensis]
MNFMRGNVGAVVRSKPISYIVGAIFGAAIVTVITVKAQQAVTTPSATYGCAIATAAQNNLNNRILMVGSTAPDPSKYFTVGGVSSCIGPISNLDLSSLIPDPMGLLTSLAKAAVNLAVQKACTAARQSLSDYLGKYNSAATMVNGGAQGMLSTAIGQQVGLNLTNYGTSYAAPAGSQTVINPLSTITGAANSSLGSTLSSAQSTATSTAQSVTAPISSGYQSATNAISSTVSGAVSSAQSGISSLGNSVFGSSGN